MRNVPRFYTNDRRVDAYEHADLFPGVETVNLIEQAKRIMHDEWEVTATTTVAVASSALASRSEL